MGCAMFLSQLLYILGIEMSGVTIATCMQPAIPVSRWPPPWGWLPLWPLAPQVVRVATVAGGGGWLV